MLLICVTGILSYGADHAYAQNDVSFTASVDQTTISSDDSLTLQLKLTGSFSGAGQPQLPQIDGFSVIGSSQSSQFSIVNGQMSSKVTFTYQLRPTRTGEITIPAISIKLNGQTYQTDPISIEVAQGSVPKPQQPATQTPSDPVKPNELNGQDLYVEAEVDNANPVIGEQIIYSFRFFQAINLFRQPGITLPDFTGFMRYDLSPDNQYYQQVAGRQYLVTEVRRALFPTAQGFVTIEPATLLVPGDFFSRDVELQTNAINVNVQPLPDGAPGGYSGAVGQYEITAEVDPSSTRINEPVTLTVRLKGTGNVGMLPDPTEKLEETLEGWRIFDPQVTANTGQVGDMINGEKVFEFPLVPKQQGDLVIPSFGLSYYDPVENEYTSIATSPMTVSVAEGDSQISGTNGNGKQEVVSLGGDIRHIKPAPTALVTEHTSILSHPLYWILWIIGLLAVTSIWFYDRRRRRLAGDVGYARSQKARKTTHRRLVEAGKLAQSDPDAAYGEVSNALTSYLGDKFNLPAAGLTRDQIRKMLTDKSVSGAEIDRILDCLEWADSGRYAPAAAGRDVSDLIDQADNVINELEEKLT